jgi:hypothetical protein
LPNYVAMITGDWTGTDVIGNKDGVHLYPAGSAVGISDDDSPSVATDYGPPATASKHRWRLNMPSLAGQQGRGGQGLAGVSAEPPRGRNAPRQLAGRQQHRQDLCGQAQPFPLRRRGPGRPDAVRSSSCSATSAGTRFRRSLTLCPTNAATCTGSVIPSRPAAVRRIRTTMTSSAATT